MAGDALFLHEAVHVAQQQVTTRDPALRTKPIGDKIKLPNAMPTSTQKTSEARAARQARRVRGAVRAAYQRQTSGAQSPGKSATSFAIAASRMA